jgi:4'-phosphopantetheinyl transferase
VIEPSWTLPPERVVIKEGELHIWRQHLNLAKDVPQFIDCLVEEEYQQGKRFIQPVHQQRFWIARAALRKILSKYLPASPEKLRFLKGSHGKPYLISDLNLQFNVSHSEDLAIYAIQLSNAVGVDVEYLQQTRFEYLEIAERFFSEHEYASLLKMPSLERRLGFYLCWTRKEAYIKAIGKGLSYPLKQFDVSLKPQGSNSLLEIEGDQERAKKWALFSMMAESNYLASIATESIVNQIAFHVLP